MHVPFIFNKIAEEPRTDWTLWPEGCLAVLVRSYLFKQGTHLFARSGSLPGHTTLALTKLWQLCKKLGQ